MSTPPITTSYTQAGAPPSLSELCQAAMQFLGASLPLKPPEIGAEVDKAEQVAIQVRDALIERRRQAGPGADRSALDKVNVALSLIAGVEYPGTGVKKEMVEQARQVLQDVLDSGAL